jgi:hypothetical protein
VTFQILAKCDGWQRVQLCKFNRRGCTPQWCRFCTGCKFAHLFKLRPPPRTLENPLMPSVGELSLPAQHDERERGRENACGKRTYWKQGAQTARNHRGKNGALL